MSGFQLRHLEEILENKDKFENEFVVEKHEYSLVPFSGKNFASGILFVEVVIRWHNHPETDVLSLVAKVPVPGSDLQVIMDSPTAFQKEVFMYEKIWPLYNQIRLECGLSTDDCFLPKYFGSRMSLIKSVTFDNDAVILLENLKTRGYFLEDQKTGLDLKHSKLVILTVAKFHALGIAAKLTKPDQFCLFKKRSRALDISKKRFSTMNTMLLNFIKEDPAACEYYYRCKEVASIDFYKFLGREVERPYYTIIHNDVWTNNIMFYRNANKDELDIKFLDFQNYLYTSPMLDLLFFIFTSTNVDIFEAEITELMEYYHHCFMSELKRLKCKVTFFSLDIMKQELCNIAKITLLPCLALLKVITSSVKKDENEMIEFKNLLFQSEYNELFRAKARRIITEYFKRNWI